MLDDIFNTHLHLSLFLCIPLSMSMQTGMECSCVLTPCIFHILGDCSFEKLEIGAEILFKHITLERWNKQKVSLSTFGGRSNERKNHIIFTSLPSYDMLSATKSMFITPKASGVRWRWIYSLCTQFPHHHPT